MIFDKYFVFVESFLANNVMVTVFFKNPFFDSKTWSLCKIEVTILGSIFKSLEAFSIAFKEVEGGTHMVMGWGTTRVATPIMF